MPRKKIYIMAPFLLILCIFAAFLTHLAMADVINDSYSEKIVKNSNKEEVLRITMQDGIITIIAKAHAATSGLRWRTIGFTITKEKITTETTAQGKKGPGPVSDAFGSGHAELMFSDAIDKVDSPPVNGIVTTSITFSAEKVQDEFGANLENIVKDTPIYLHAIFQTYDNATGAVRSGKAKLVNWTQIMNAEGWGNDTLNDFEKYYNMMIKFQPAKQKNYLHYVLDNETSIDDTISLDKALPGKTVSWTKKQAPATKTYKKVQYSLYKYYVKKHGKNKKEETHYVKDKDGCTLKDIQTNNTKVYLGGMDIYLVYKKAPTITPTPTGSPSTTPAPSGTPSNTPIPTEEPEPEPEPETISEEINLPQANGVIRADIRGNERFEAYLSIPSTESLYTNVFSDQYLMGYIFEKQVGTQYYPVKVSKTYNMVWEGQDAKGKKKLKDSMTVVQYVTIKRSYAYWEIKNFDYFVIDYAKIWNEVLPGGTSVMKADSGAYSPPKVNISHSPELDRHLIVPEEFINGVTLEPETLTGGKDKPTVPTENFTSQANKKLPQLTVKNDSLVMDGVAVISDTEAKKEAPAVNTDYLSKINTDRTEKCNANVLYKPDQVIEATTKNKEYNSSGMITYKKVEGIASCYIDTIEGNIEDLNSVTVHTPVVCEPIVTADNDKYVQLIKPTSAVQLVLDPDSSLNDFTLQISNTGMHVNKLGYYTRDFSRSLRDPAHVSYLASDSSGTLRNEVKFPFDVYMKSDSTDQYIEKNTWIVLGRSSVTFYLPMWVQEGTYTASCRSIAVNADPDKIDLLTEERANTSLYTYVATNTFGLEVSGRLYGLTVYDMTDYPTWKEIFRVKHSLQLKINNRSKYQDGTTKSKYSKNYSYDYTVGTNDQYGDATGRYTKYTFPLVNGNHPYYKNIGVLKTGYAVRFKLNTIGTMYGSGCSVKLKPTFYYVDENGKNRVKVDIYYHEEINGKNRRLVKVGSNLDQMNLKTMEVGSPYVGIPKEDMKNTASILNMKYSYYLSRWDNLFSFSQINILSTFRTYVNKSYTKKTAGSDQYGKIKANGITTNTMMKQMQTWYGSYYLPGSLHAVNPSEVPNGWTVYQYANRKGITYHEAWWKKSGYLIVNFDIVTIDSQGNERLSYLNASNYLNNRNCCMWSMEGAPVSKTDNKGTTFSLKAGDFMMYYAGKSVTEDYKAGGIY